ncbi:MAG: MBL fold metallo-hydrolase [Deltaproteobacteria bacterium]|nr:MBL fold metallo-hydrolase [Deltaproteobacteria bacterium]MBK8713158.1 MBL fold metallo-hydrolase [Deltaproteobacteria bacterium]MBP7286736.1 MBL fold metallo-hydrolase [Nannocystaceae bacterium]
MQVQAFFDARSSTLTYVVFDPKTHDAVVIDPVLDYESVGSYTFTESLDQLVDFVKKNQLRVHWSLETHAHADHLSGGPLLRRRCEAKVGIGGDITKVQSTFKDLFALEQLATDGSQFDRTFRDGEVIQAGSLAIEVIATPGHTPACVTYKIDDALFTGDLLFMDDYGTGRCDFPGGSAAAMYDSVQKLYALGDALRVFPGHDYPPDGREVRWETTVAASRDHNPQLSAKTGREEFVRARNERDAKLAAPKLLFQSVQVNIDGGRLPAANAAGRRYLVLPINLLRPADELGEPKPRS